MSLDSNETYRIAHTAQCKLRLSVDRPDRNLRFVLGHAFTLDKILLRIVEIEDEEKLTAEKEKMESPTRERRVSFRDNSNRPTGELRSGADMTQASTRKSRRAPSPPPDSLDHGSDTSSDDDDDDEEATDLGLCLTTSHSARPPPHLVADDGESDEEDEPISPPWTPSDSELATITQGKGDEMLTELYESVRSCRCQDAAGEKGPAIEQIWEVPVSKEGGKGMKMGRRTAVVHIAA